jgi:hypothetical protein
MKSAASARLAYGALAAVALLTVPILLLRPLEDGPVPFQHYIAVPFCAVGIWAIRERAAELGGTCLVERATPAGTTVQAHLPLELP